MVIRLSNIDIKVDIDKDRYRPIDIEIVEANISKIKADTGWQPKISIENSIKDCLEYWRNTV